MGRNAEVVEAFWAAYERGDLDGALETLADDGVFIQPGMPEIRGRDGLRQMLAGWRQAFPDLHHEPHEVIESGETVAVRLRVRGTHQGTMQMPDGRELPPTGREAIWESVDWITLRDGRIHTWRVYQDTADFMASLGLMDEPAATPAT